MWYIFIGVSLLLLRKKRSLLALFLFVSLSFNQLFLIFFFLFGLKQVYNFIFGMNLHCVDIQPFLIDFLLQAIYHIIVLN